MGQYDLANSNSVETEKMTTGDNNYMNEMYQKAVKSGRIADAICWVIMIIQVIQFLIVYLKRLITIIFLIAIFPLVTLTYALDKVGDGKAQAFGNWCKEYFLQVFIQSFHAINYVLVMGIVLQLNSSNSNWFLKVISITYIAKGGDILRSLFAQMSGGTGKDGGPLNVAKAMVQGQMVVGGIRKIGNVASKTFGSKSMLGRGVKLVSQGKDQLLERSVITEERKAEQQVRLSRERANAAAVVSRDSTAIGRAIDTINTSSGTTGTTQEEKGTEQERKREEAKKTIQNASVEDLVKYTKTKGFTQEDIESIMDIKGLTGEQKEQFLDTLTYAGALTALKNPKGKSNIQIRTLCEIVIRDRMIAGMMKEEDASGNPNLLKQFVEGETSKNPKKGGITDQQLHELMVQSSVTINPNIPVQRPYAKVEKVTNPDTVRSAMQGIREAYKGERGLEDYQNCVNIAKAAKESNNASIREIVEKEEEEIGFTVDEFERRLVVHRIAESDHNKYLYDGVSKEYLNDAINLAVQTQEDANQEYIIEGLNAKASCFTQEQKSVLQQGVAKREKAERQERNTQKSVAEKIREKQDQFLAKEDPNSLLGYRGEEYEEYLGSRATEIGKEARRNVVRGVATIAVGGVVGAYKAGVTTTVSGMTLGATSDTKDDIVGNFTSIIPSAASATEDLMHRSSEGVVNAVSGLTNWTKDVAGVKTQKPTYETIKKSVTINQKEFDSDARAKWRQQRDTREREKALSESEELDRLIDVAEGKKRKLEEMKKKLGL